jgi:hypothetical protein
MTKIAFFVEGQTERIFVESFLNSYYTHPYFNVESYELRGGNAKIVTKSNYDDETINFQFLIYDVGGDGRIASEIFERHDHLINKAGYNHIFGIRDLHPNSHDDLGAIKHSLINIFNNNEILQKLTLVVAVMEIEAWFLADYNFFTKVDKSLTVKTINDNLNISIRHDDIESYDHPAKLIDRIYRIANKRYKKRESDSYTICSHIDFDDLYLNTNKRNRIPSFDSFVKKLDKF